MDNQQRAGYENKINEYIETNKIPEYFESLTQQLIINQPEDPYKFLIEYLETRRRQRVILVHGIISKQRDEVASELGSLLNYQIKIVKSNNKDFKLESDQSVKNQVDEFVNKLESHFTGLIVSGYPNNYQQAIHSQKLKKIPERIFIIRHSEQDLQEYYSQIYDNDVQKIAAARKRDELDEKELINQYREYTDIFEFEDYLNQKKQIVSNMQHILQLKDNKVAPLRSPRIVITAPPHIRKRTLEVAQAISKEYGLYLIDLQSVIDDHIDRKTEVGKYLFRNLKMRKEIPLDIIISLVKTQMLKPVAKHKGYVLVGYPTNLQQLQALVSLKINPNMILTLQENESILKQSYTKIMFDPLFGTRYEQDLEVDSTTKDRLKLDEFSEEEQDKVIAEYNKLLNHINGEFSKFVVKVNMSTEDNELMLRNVNNHLNNPSIYGDH